MSWANQRLLEILQSLENENQEVCRLFSHILFAEKIWINRLQGLDSSLLPVCLDADIEVCAELVMQNKESLTTFFTHLANTDLDKFITTQIVKEKSLRVLYRIF